MEDVDKSSMDNMVRAFPRLLTSVEIPKEVRNLCTKLGDKNPKGICIIGMGGSAIAGDYVQGLLSDESVLPILTIRDSTLPKFIDDRWVTLVVSYSGNTEETLEAFKECVHRGCQTITFSSGGVLSTQSANGVVPLPEGFQPRAAFPILFSALIQTVECILECEKTNMKKLEGILSGKLESWESSPLAPKSMANDLLIMTPIFIGSRHLIPVAYRAKCQFNENAKVMAFHSEIPESNHNEIESFNEMNDQTILPLFLSSSFVDERLVNRYDIVSQIYEEEGYMPIRLSMKSGSKAEEMLAMTLYLDMVSTELANLRGVDPLSVEKIIRLKQELGNL